MAPNVQSEVGLTSLETDSRHTLVILSLGLPPGPFPGSIKSFSVFRSAGRGGRAGGVIQVLIL